MRAVDIIRRKRDGQILDAAEIDAFVQGATHGDWPDYQLSALLMAICCRGLDERETADLTSSMVQSGSQLDLSDLPGPKIDKHSTGGVGDKISLILAPLAAACGVVVPMMSGRGLGHSGGTLDKLESIPGFRVNLSLNEMRTALKKVGCVMIGQTKEIAPADRVLYSLRDVTGTVESIPLITGSIMSKKIAEGIDGLVLDVKFGRGAFMKTADDARRLARSLVQTGVANGVNSEAVLTPMDEPLGIAVGNALEVEEAISILRNESSAQTLIDLSVYLTARMVLLAGIDKNIDKAQKRVKTALTSGAALEVFRKIVRQQGGDTKVVTRPATILPRAKHRHFIAATRPGFVRGIHAEKLGRATVLLGAGRNQVKDRVDPAAGALILVNPNEEVPEGECIVELHYNNSKRLAEAIALAEDALEIGDEPSPPLPLFNDVIEQRGHDQ